MLSPERVAELIDTPSCDCGMKNDDNCSTIDRVNNKCIYLTTDANTSNLPH